MSIRRAAASALSASAAIIVIAVTAIAVTAIAVTAYAADVRTAGKLDLPANAGVVAICTDPVVQNVLTDALRAARRSSAPDPSEIVTLTVTVNQQVLAPGVSLNQLFPGDPSMVELLKAAGAEPPPLGDTGDAPSADPYEIQARRRALSPQDPLTENFRSYQTMQQQLSGANAPTPYESIPKNELYDTIIVARASIEGSLDQLKVVAVVHSGDDPRKAKALVAEEIANAALH